jgi:hypothetical protein
MNRRDFLGNFAGVATFGFAVASANAGAVFGHDSPPEGYPPLNWIDLPTPVSDAVMPYRGDYLVGGHDGIYRVRGVSGPFKVTKDHRGCPCRLWAMYIDQDCATVQLWHR